jgi:molybdate transport system regulatory protein
VPPPRKRPAKTVEPTIQFRLRVMHRGEIALGPGKVELLRAIRAHGSIAQAAKTLEMSYMRAWTLVQVMNNAFREPLVTVDRGGAKGGEARLTDLGGEVLGLYEAMVKESRKATGRNWAKLKDRLKR